MRCLLIGRVLARKGAGRIGSGLVMTLTEKGVEVAIGYETAGIVGVIGTLWRLAGPATSIPTKSTT